MSKLSFAIIADDIRPEWIERNLNHCRYDEKIVNHVCKHLEYKLIGTQLKEVMNYSGTPDYFIIDMSSLSNYDINDREYVLLKKFAEKHTSSIFCIVSFVAALAKAAFDELKEFLQDEVKIETYVNGAEALASYMFNKVLEYYPYE